MKSNVSSPGHVQWKFPGTTIPLAAEESMEQPSQPFLSTTKVRLLWQKAARKVNLDLLLAINPVLSLHPSYFRRKVKRVSL